VCRADCRGSPNSHNSKNNTSGRTIAHRADSSSVLFQETNNGAMFSRGDRRVEPFPQCSPRPCSRGISGMLCFKCHRARIGDRILIPRILPPPEFSRPVPADERYILAGRVVSQSPLPLYPVEVSDIPRDRGSRADLRGKPRDKKLGPGCSGVARGPIKTTTMGEPPRQTNGRGEGGRQEAQDDNDSGGGGGSGDVHARERAAVLSFSREKERWRGAGWNTGCDGGAKRGRRNRRAGTFTLETSDDRSKPGSRDKSALLTIGRELRYARAAVLPSTGASLAGSSAPRHHARRPTRSPLPPSRGGFHHQGRSARQPHAQPSRRDLSLPPSRPPPHEHRWRLHPSSSHHPVSWIATPIPLLAFARIGPGAHGRRSTTRGEQRQQQPPWRSGASRG